MRWIRIKTWQMRGPQIISLSKDEMGVGGGAALQVYPFVIRQFFCPVPLSQRGVRSMMVRCRWGHEVWMCAVLGPTRF
jgi:hypothetical protein